MCNHIAHLKLNETIGQLIPASTYVPTYLNILCVLISMVSMASLPYGGYIAKANELIEQE